jgi:RimJ/RimL family protein N-acetyltransferase
MIRVVLPAEPLRDGPTSLRPWRDTDVAALVSACQDPEIARWTSVPNPYGEADARAYLLHRFDAIHAANAAPFAIVDSASGALLGSIALNWLDWKNLRGEVGYWLALEARGHGHATRGVRLICDWGFDALGLERIELLAATANPASQLVAERAGFRREAVLRSYMVGHGARQDMVAFAILRADRRSHPRALSDS